MYQIRAIRSFAVWRPVECVHPLPQTGAFFLLLPRNCHSAGELLETRVPRYAPPTCGGSVLAGFQTPECGGPGQGPSGSGPSLGTRHALACHSSRQTGTEAPSNRPTAHSLTPATTVREPPHAIHRPHQAGALFSIQPRNCQSASRFHQTRGPALGTAPAHGRLGFCACGTSGRQTTTSAHARFRAGNGEERGRTQHAPNPAMLPLANPPAVSRPPCLSQGPMIASPPRNCHSASRFHQTGA